MIKETIMYNKGAIEKPVQHTGYGWPREYDYDYSGSTIPWELESKCRRAIEAQRQLAIKEGLTIGAKIAFFDNKGLWQEGTISRYLYQIYEAYEGISRDKMEETTPYLFSVKVDNYNFTKLRVNEVTLMED